MEQFRACTTCKQVKPFKDFSKDKSRKYGISYRCKDCHKEVNRKYYDKEKSAVAAKKSYWKNRDQINQRARLKRQLDPESYRSYKRAYYQANKERINKLSNEWRNNNKETTYRSKVRRRARLKLAAYKPYTVTEVLNVYGTNCYLCQQPIDLLAPRWTAIKGWEKGLHLDHVIPIRDAGPDILENVRPTHAICNLKKH